MQSDNGDSDIDVFDNLQPAEPGSINRDDADAGETTINIAPYARIIFSADPQTGECTARIQYRVDQPTPMISMQGRMASDLYREIQRRLTRAPFQPTSEPRE